MRSFLRVRGQAQVEPDLWVDPCRLSGHLRRGAFDDLNVLLQGS
jgi:hypothetical protein